MLREAKRKNVDVMVMNVFNYGKIHKEIEQNRYCYRTKKYKYINGFLVLINS